MNMSSQEVCLNVLCLTCISDTDLVVWILTFLSYSFLFCWVFLFVCLFLALVLLVTFLVRVKKYHQYHPHLSSLHYIMHYHISGRHI